MSHGRSPDIFGAARITSLQAAAAVAATTTGSSVDVSDLAGQALAFFELGDLAGFTALDVTIEHSDDGGVGDAWTTYATFPQVTADGLSTLQVDVDGIKATARTVFTFTGAGTATIVGGLVSSGHVNPTG